MEIPARFYFNTLRRVKLVNLGFYSFVETAGEAAAGLLVLISFCWLFGHSLPQYVVRNVSEPSCISL